MYFKTKYVVFKPMYKLLLLTGLHINLIDQETFETQFQNAKPDPLTLGFSYIKKSAIDWKLVEVNCMVLFRKKRQY